MSSANAIWEGGLKTGKGSFAAGKEVCASYTFASRFEGAKPGSNPEEMLAAAEAACFSMAMAAGLERAGYAAERIDTKADCALESIGERPTVTTIRLTTRVRAPGLSRDVFLGIASQAKENCPLSRALEGNVTVILDAELAA